ncbi:SIR2 family protein [Geomonas propionica]|uniref:SIR2 family protein n=1 Tax=Geomonas propionica TaxID=2798582 RepID=A0ABS0YM86_9BACT|nr:SIR2 family protein [Geomonas propionica]MBJ6798622.1 SIR2 family protein [Geomonas propionica]
MKAAILKRLIKNDHQPLLFVGSGLSIRYIGLENWEGLLRRFANQATDNALAYEMYVQAAKSMECKEGLFPKVAELIEHDFNKKWFTSAEYEANRKLHADLVKEGISPFKIEIASSMKEKSQNPLAAYATEIELFKKLEKRSISGVVTTNYDSFIEDCFPSYTPYIGQEELFFSPLHGISEIYKIHGCCTKPGTIVINETDYVDFSDTNAYLAAKLLTFFIEHPIIFLGYSISDTNIERILKSIVRCLSKENLEKIKERLFFIVRAKGEEAEEISTYTKAFEGGKSIDMTKIRLKTYEPLYQAMLENQAKYNAPVLRRLKQDIYELVLTNKPSGKIRTVNLEDEKLEDVEIVVGVGVLAEFGKTGYGGLTAEEIYKDVVFNDRDFNAVDVVNLALPTLLAHNSNNLPVHKYLNGYQGQVPERVGQAKKNKFDDLLSSTAIKNRAKSKFRDETIGSLRKNHPAWKCLQELPNLKQENIDADELGDFLRQTLKDHPQSLSKGDTGFKTGLKRAIRIYDWLKYH